MGLFSGLKSRAVAAYSAFKAPNKLKHNPEDKDKDKGEGPIRYPLWPRDRDPARGAYTQLGYKTWKEIKKLDKGEVSELSYHAADFSRSSGQKATSVSGSGDLHLRLDRETLIAESDRMDRDVPVYSAILDRMVDTIIGNGFKLQMKTGRPKLDKEIEKKWAEEISPQADIRNFNSWQQTQRQIVRAWLAHGDMAALKIEDEVVHPTIGPRISRKLQLFEALQINYPQRFGVDKDGFWVEQGIRLGNRKEFLGCYIAPYTLGGYITNLNQTFYPKEKLLFLSGYDMRFSQTRGTPMFQSCMPIIHMLNDVLASEAYSWQVQSRQALTVNAPEGGALGDLTSASDASKTNSHDVPVKYQEFDNAMVFYSRDGKIEGMPRTAPAIHFDKSVLVYLKLIGMKVGMPIEILFLDWSQTNYSSSKAAQELLQRKVTGMREAIASRIHIPFLQWVVRGWAMNDELDEAIGMDLDDPQLTKHDWIAPAMPWLDLFKESKGWTERLESGQTLHSTMLKQADIDPSEFGEQREQEIRSAIVRVIKLKKDFPDYEVDWRLFAGLKEMPKTASPIKQEEPVNPEEPINPENDGNPKGKGNDNDPDEMARPARIVSITRDRNGEIVAAQTSDGGALMFSEGKWEKVEEVESK